MKAIWLETWERRRRNKCKKINGHFEVKTLGEEWSNVSGSECIGRCGQLPLKGSASSDLASVCEDCCNKKLDSNCVLVLLFHSYFVSSNKRRIKKRLQMINLLLGYARALLFSLCGRKNEQTALEHPPLRRMLRIMLLLKMACLPPKNLLGALSISHPHP